MNLLFRTYSLFPLALVKNKTLNIGDIVQIGENKYYINCAPNTISPTGKNISFIIVFKLLIIVKLLTQYN